MFCVPRRWRTPDAEGFVQFALASASAARAAAGLGRAGGISSGPSETRINAREWRASTSAPPTPARVLLTEARASWAPILPSARAVPGDRVRSLHLAGIARGEPGWTGAARAKLHAVVTGDLAAPGAVINSAARVDIVFHLAADAWVTVRDRAAEVFANNVRHLHVLKPSQLRPHRRVICIIERDLRTRRPSASPVIARAHLSVCGVESGRAIVAIASHTYARRWRSSGRSHRTRHSRRDPIHPRRAAPGRSRFTQRRAVARVSSSPYGGRFDRAPIPAVGQAVLRQRDRRHHHVDRAPDPRHRRRTVEIVVDVAEDGSSASAVIRAWPSDSAAGNDGELARIAPTSVVETVRAA